MRLEIEDKAGIVGILRSPPQDIGEQIQINYLRERQEEIAKTLGKERLAVSVPRQFTLIGSSYSPLPEPLDSALLGVGRDLRDNYWLCVSVNFSFHLPIAPKDISLKEVKLFEKILRDPWGFCREGAEIMRRRYPRKWRDINSSGAGILYGKGGEPELSVGTSFGSGNYVLSFCVGASGSVSRSIMRSADEIIGDINLLESSVNTYLSPILGADANNSRRKIYLKL